MKPNLVTLRKTRPDVWEIDFVGSCGMLNFPSVVVVVDAQSRNPGIHVEKPFGLRGMKRAIQLIEEERAKIGLTTME